MPMSPLSRLLQEIRTRHGLTITELAATIGMVRPRASIIVSGKHHAPEGEELRRAVEGLTTALKLSEEEQQEIFEAARQSPRKLKIPSDASEAAFRFIAALQERWNDLGSEEFEALLEQLNRFSRG